MASQVPQVQVQILNLVTHENLYPFGQYHGLLWVWLCGLFSCPFSTTIVLDNTQMRWWRPFFSCQYTSMPQPVPSKVMPVTALLFSSHIFCSVFISMRSDCLNHKSPAIRSVTCSAWAPLYGWSQVLSELRYMVVTNIGLAELSLSQEYLVWE